MQCSTILNSPKLLQKVGAFLFAFCGTWALNLATWALNSPPKASPRAPTSPCGADPEPTSHLLARTDATVPIAARATHPCARAATISSHPLAAMLRQLSLSPLLRVWQAARRACLRHACLRHACLRHAYLRDASIVSSHIPSTRVKHATPLAPRRHRPACLPAQCAATRPLSLHLALPSPHTAT